MATPSTPSRPLLHSILGAGLVSLLFVLLYVIVTAQGSVLHLTGVAIAPACPVSVGTATLWSATATGGTAPVQYRFWLRNDTAGTWTILSDYGVATASPWTPSAPGTYFIQVWARSAASTAEWEDWRNSAPCVVPTPPVITSVSLQPSASHYVGHTGTWAIAATSGTPPLQYRYWLRDEAARTWQMLQDYSTAATASWTPTRAGRYSLQVWVRSAGSVAEWDAWLNSAVVDVLGPPAAPGWTALVRTGGNHVVHWPSILSAQAYRVYWSTSRELLQGATPAGTSLDVVAPPFVRPVADPDAPTYYRVAGLSGPLTGAGGPIAVSTSMQPIVLAAPRVTPALWDVDGDGCLDMVGGRGNCDGTFEPYSLTISGLAGLFAPGRINRDSRFADYNGDGRPDIFTNVYSRAGDLTSTAILHLGAPSGVFTTDPGIAAMALGGFGETVLAADFDNDGDVDIFSPNYTHVGDGGRNRLLINDGAGHFTDWAETAGVAINVPYAPEGAQALDFNQDGWIDIFVASRIYINNSNLTFTDVAASVGLPERFDEGMRLFDVDLDGDLDLVHHDGSITRLYRNDNGRFVEGINLGVGAPDKSFGYGLTVCDVNGDAFEDVVVAYNRRSDTQGRPQLLVNVGGTLVRSDWVSYAETYNDLLACADLDLSGMPDVLARSASFRTLLNRASSGRVIKLRVLGADGQRNQQGRIVRVQPTGAPGRTIVRVIESGSGYMAQGDYDLLIAAPWSGPYDVAVRLATGWFHATANPGDELAIYADGRVEAGLGTIVPRITSVSPEVTSGVVGVPVTWTAASVGGASPYTYQFWVHDGDTWTLGRDWAASSSWTWNPPEAGTFRFQVWIRSARSAAPYDNWRAFGPFVAHVPGPVAVTALSTSHTFPVPVHTPVTWTAGAVDGIGPYAYQYHVFDGTTWAIGRDWSSGNTWTWMPATSGTYSFQVWVRNAGSQNAYDAWRGAGPVGVSGPAPLAVASLDASPSTGLVTGNPVTFTATAVGGSGPYTYQFWIHDGLMWSIGQAWSASNSCTAVPTLSGSYSLQVWVRNAASSSLWDAWRGLGPFVVTVP